MASRSCASVAIGNLVRLIRSCSRHQVRVDAKAYHLYHVQKGYDPSDVKGSGDNVAIVSPVAADTTAKADVIGPVPRSSSFDHIANLIMKGEPVPNVRVVPDTVLSGHESSPGVTSRKKPWEN